MGVNIYLKSYTDSKGKSQLEVKIRDKQHQYTKSLFKITRTDFNPKTLRIKATNPLATSYNKKLDKIKATMYDSFDLYKAGLYTWSELIRRINTQDASNDLDGFIKSVIEPQYQGNTVNNYQNAVNSFKRVLGFNKLLFSDINYPNIISYINILKQTKRPATINSYIKRIAALVNEAHRRNLAPEPFARHRAYHQKVRLKQAEVVTPELLKQTISKVRTIYEFQSLAMWMLSFCLRGLYQKDLAILHKMPRLNHDKWDDKRYIQHTRSKTGEPMQLLYSIEPTESILNTLQKSFKITHDKDFAYDTLQLFDYDVNDFNKHRAIFSGYIHNLKRQLGYTHKTSRKTFESVAVQLDISSAIRYRLLGHSDSTVKKHYIMWQSKDLIDKVDAAHIKILEHYGIAEMWLQLEDKYYTITGDKRGLRIA